MPESERAAVTRVLEMGVHSLPHRGNQLSMPGSAVFTFKFLLCIRFVSPFLTFIHMYIHFKIGKIMVTVLATLPEEFRVCSR